jgi:hypothetical protein
MDCQSIVNVCLSFERLFHESMHLRLLFSLAWTLLAVGCTSVSVTPMPPGVSEVAIRDNPKVTVPDFVDVVRDGFHRHGIRTKVISENANAGDDYVLTYTALRSWDLATYLSKAELWITHKGNPAGHAEYHLRNKGGLALNKWADVESKMTPVMDELLSNYPALKKAPTKP